jgi:ceramide glucosyltransferase
VSILKPVRGLDEDFRAAIRSHANQQYPAFEILFGAASLEDPAVPEIRRLIAEFPDVPIRLIHSTTPAPNGKAGVLVDLAREARHAILLVNDSDISVPPDYLERTVAPLRSPEVGLVTCLYRAAASSLAGKWEAFGIAADFIPSTLVAPLVGVREFGLGSTLVFRREDLEAIGGFEAIRDYIADDYQLARRITRLGKRAHLSETVVETHLSDPDWAAVWRHQVRWARTIRVSRGDGYAGLPVTHAGVWALLCLLAGLPVYAAALIALRVCMALGGALAVRDARAALLSPLAPLWDFWAFAVWIAGWAGREVEWRGGRSRLTADGRLVPLPPSPLHSTFPAPALHPDSAHPVPPASSAMPDPGSAPLAPPPPKTSGQDVPVP